MSLPATPSVGSLERALRDLRRDIDSLRADIFTSPRPMRATLDMGGNRIVNLGKPIDQLDAETKAGRAASGVSTFAKSGSAGLTGAVTISEGSNITLTQTGQNIEITGSTGGTGDLLADGTVPLTANWDAGAYKVTANQLESDVATGTAPLIVASTTKVTNLNADQVDGVEAAAFGLVANPLSQFAATTSAQLAGVISNETGAASGTPLLVFNVNPTLTGATMAGTLACNGNAITGAAQCTPDSDNARDFGSASFSWRDAHIQRNIVNGANTFSFPVAGGTFALAGDLSAYQPLDALLTSLATLAFAGNSLKVLRVNAGETDFELAAVTATDTTYANSLMLMGA